MLKKIKSVAVIVLATLGVLFIILMLMPDDEEDYADEEQYAQEQTSSDQDEDDEDDVTSVAEESSEDESEQTESVASQDDADDADAEDQAEAKEDETESDNTVTVNIPSGELSDNVIKFKTLSLDNEKVTQDIFADYDITIVHVWGTYCGPCLEEMPDYGSFYKELPDNVNLIGIINDVYDGIDRNVSNAKDVLNDADAGFLNLRVSDDVYDVIKNIRVIPTTFFVDKEGHVIGEPVEGRISSVKKRLDGYIE